MSVLKLTATLLAPGAGKPLLIVGAGLGTGVRALWSEAVAELPDYEIVGVDLPGHGASPAAAAEFSVADLAVAVAGIAAELQRGQPGSRKVYYTGVSLAGAVGLQLGVAHPEAFSAIAPICSAARFGEPQDWLDRGQTVSVQGTPTQVVRSARGWFAPGFMDAHPARAAGLLHTLQDADRFSYAFACRALADFDLRDRLSEIQCPLLAIAGEHDPICPPAGAVSIAAAVQSGRSAVVAGAAHQAPLECPRETAALLRSFFA